MRSAAFVGFGWLTFELINGFMKVFQRLFFSLKFISPHRLKIARCPSGGDYLPNGWEMIPEAHYRHIDPKDLCGTGSTACVGKALFGVVQRPSSRIRSRAFSIPFWRCLWSKRIVTQA